MATNVCRFCGIQIALDESALSSGAIVCLGTNVVHRDRLGPGVVSTPIAPANWGTPTEGSNQAKAPPAEGFHSPSGLTRRPG